LYRPACLEAALVIRFPFPAFLFSSPSYDIDTFAELKYKEGLHIWEWGHKKEGTFFIKRDLPISDTCRKIAHILEPANAHLYTNTHTSKIHIKTSFTNTHEKIHSISAQQHFYRAIIGHFGT
jgi:hypothetical protein